MRARKLRVGMLAACAGGLVCLGSPLAMSLVRWTGDAIGHPSPVLPAPLVDPLRASPTFAPSRPATPGAERVLATLERVEANLRSTRYRHATRVVEERGSYDWDCSGMVSWVLARSSPRAHAALPAARPRALHYARHIEAAPTDRSRRGWRRVGHIRDVRPGDVFAWEIPGELRRHATGHVGFARSRAVQIRDSIWALRITDSTSGGHQDDTRAFDGDGYGVGTMTFVTDERGHATAYGWWGSRSPAYVALPVVFGRVD